MAAKRWLLLPKSFQNLKARLLHGWKNSGKGGCRESSSAVP
jgi:hypothetical protein